MEDFSDLRHAITRILGQAIGPGQFKKVIKDRDRMGAFGTKEQMESIIAILEFLEAKFDHDEKTEIV